MISVPRVFQQAKEYGHSVKREFSFLIAHSVLHLLGYDHMEKKKPKLWRETEESPGGTGNYKVAEKGGVL